MAAALLSEDSVTVGATPRAALAAARFRVSCIMPAFNERDGIRAAVAQMRQAAADLTSDFEIIVVDDGSNDGTDRVLAEIADDDALRVVTLPTNLGYGRALRVGFAAASHPLIFFMDSDGQFDPLDLRRLLALSEEADMVVGYRVGRCDGRLRSLLSGGYNAMVRRVFDIDARDVNCAFKLFRREALAQLALSADGYAINAEMLARARTLGLRVREVGVAHRPRLTGESKVGVRAIPRALWQLGKLHRVLRGRADIT